jgi:hypothetical protein
VGRKIFAVAAHVQMLASIVLIAVAVAMNVRREKTAALEDAFP